MAASGAMDASSSASFRRDSALQLYRDPMNKIRLTRLLCILGRCVSMGRGEGLAHASAAPPRSIREVLDSWFTNTERAVVPAADGDTGYEPAAGHLG
jgi:hypothetical protein